MQIIITITQPYSRSMKIDPKPDTYVFCPHIVESHGAFHVHHSHTLCQLCLRGTGYITSKTEPHHFSNIRLVWLSLSVYLKPILSIFILRK